MNLTLTQATSLLQKHIEKQSLKIKNDEVLEYFNHKIRHTYAVLFDTQRILTFEKDIFNTDELKNKVEVASLLHDIARFYQNNGERILSGTEFEHGDAGYHILKQEGIDDLSILLAVKYHNKKVLSTLYTDKEYLFSSKEKQKEIELVSKIVRDADKIQNLEYIIYSDRNKLFGLNENSNTITGEVLKEFYNEKLVDKNITKTSIDKLLALGAWVFDLNFNTSKRILKQAGFVEFIENKLVLMNIDKDTLDTILSKIKKHLDV